MSVISNPLGTGIGNTDLVNSQFPSTRPIKVGSVAVTAGQVVVWEAINTTTAPPTVIPLDAGTSDPAMIAGVAVVGAGVGGVALICRSGPCKVNIDDDTVSAGQQATGNATADGCAAGVTADATTVTGDTFGVFLGAEIGSTNQAYVDVRIGS